MTKETIQKRLAGLEVEFERAKAECHQLGGAIAILKELLAPEPAEEADKKE